MSDAIAGVDPLRVDTVAAFALGTEVKDPRAVDFPLNQIRYIKAGSAIALGDALKVKADEAQEPNVLIPTSAVSQIVVGVAHTAIPSGSFGWVTVGGRVPAAKVAAATAAEAKLGSSGTAGTLVGIDAGAAYVQAEARAAIAAAASVGLQALDAEASGLAEVYIQ